MPPPTNPPPRPPEPSAEPTVVVSPYAVRLSLTIAGDLASFDASAYRTSLAASLDVSPSSVRLAVRAASVLVEATILADRSYDASALRRALEGLIFSDQLDDALGVTIEAVVAPTILTNVTVDRVPPLSAPPSPAAPRPNGCCTWPRAARCEDCIAFAAPNNWLAQSEDNCQSPLNNPYVYSWCPFPWPSPPPPPPASPMPPTVPPSSGCCTWPAPLAPGDCHACESFAPADNWLNIDPTHCEPTWRWCPFLPPPPPRPPPAPPTPPPPTAPAAPPRVEGETISCCESPATLQECGEFPFGARCRSFVSQDTEWGRWLDASAANCESQGHIMCPWVNDTVACDDVQTLGIGTATDDAPLERARALARPSPEAMASGNFDYREALRLATSFFSSQRSGPPRAPGAGPPWMPNGSFIADGEAAGLDLHGGYADAGDYVKSTKTIGHSMALLAWALLEFRDGFAEAGALQAALESLRWGAEYLVRCHPHPDLLVVQVGDFVLDHSTWAPPPLHRPPTGPRRVFNLTRGQPMVDVATEAAAALAASASVFAASVADEELARTCVRAAASLLGLADAAPAPADQNNPSRRPDVFPQCDVSECFYASGGRVQDKLAWATAWLAIATERLPDALEVTSAAQPASAYASSARRIIDEHLRTSDEDWRAEQPFSWDSKWPAVYVIAAAHLAHEGAANASDEHIYRWSTVAAEAAADAQDTACRAPPCVRATPGGLIFYQSWGSLRYASHIAFLALARYHRAPPSDASRRSVRFARGQLNYILGRNPSNRSYVTGFGRDPPVRIHHRGASGLDGFCAFSRLRDEPNRYPLLGALVGGPYCGEVGAERWECDGYQDRREDVVRNEVAIDYNAGLVAALAALSSPPAPPPLRRSEGQCCTWPRAARLSGCDLCLEIAAADNWIAQGEDFCLWSGNAHRYTWCPADASMPLASDDDPDAARRPPRTRVEPVSVLIFGMEVLVVVASFIAAFASLEKVFVLLTWAWNKLNPHLASEAQYLRETTIDPTAPGSAPHVCVQCPIYNDREVCERVIDAACRLEYPRERLEVYVMDDSTDELTKQKIDERVAFWSALGVRIRLCRRPNREGFKAGNMLAFHHLVSAEYIAIFDSDFIPYPDFLLRAVPYLVDNPELGFVQGRWTYINQDESTFTRWIEVTLNQHIKGEQFTRSACRTFLQFNGSGGIWRKACMDSAGGWNDETLVEDMDLSLRAYLIGWHALWLHDLRTPNELPSAYGAYRRQQYRWVYGPMQLYKRCVGFIWQSSLPLHHKLYIVVFFFSTRSTSLIANATYFTFLLPLLALVHYAYPEHGVLVPWWSALLLPIVTTASVLVHTPRSLKYAVLYVLYENVLALHKAVAALEGMVGYRGGFRWPVTIKTGRMKKHGLSRGVRRCSLASLIGFVRHGRKRVFVREVVVGVYLVFMGVFLSRELRHEDFYWFYGVYSVTQGIVYLLFGLSLVDALSFEPDMPEAMRRPYRRQLSEMRRPVSAKLASKLAASHAAVATRRLSDRAAFGLRQLAVSPQGHHRANEGPRRWHPPLPASIPSALARARGAVLRSRRGPRSHVLAASGGLPWEWTAGGAAEADAAEGDPAKGEGKRSRAECFVHVNAQARVASGSFVDLPSITSPRAADSHACPGDRYAPNYAPSSPPPSPPQPVQLPTGRRTVSPAGDAALRRIALAKLAAARDATNARAQRVRASLAAGRSANAPGPLVPPPLPPPTSRHLRSVLPSYCPPAVASALPSAAGAPAANAVTSTVASGLDAFGAVGPPPSESSSTSGELERMKSVSGPGGLTAAIPPLRTRMRAHAHRLVLSLPLWALNGVTAVGIWLCVADLHGVELGENLLCLSLFTLLLPALLIWTYGQPAANTRDAWASLEGRLTPRQRQRHALQLLLLGVGVAFAFAATLYTSSSRFRRWLRCELPWLPERRPRSYAVNVTELELELLERNLSWSDLRADVNVSNATWQCGDGFFT